MKFKKVLSAVLVVIMAMLMLAGCNDSEKTESSNETKITEQVTKEEKTDKAEEITEEELPEPTTKQEVVHATDYITSIDDFKEKVGYLIDLSAYPTPTETDTICSYTLDYDTRKNITYDLDYSIKLADGTQFTMPVPVKELEKQGWVLTQNPEVEGGHIVSGPSMKKDKAYITLKGVNPGEETCSFDECYVVGYQDNIYTTDHSKRDSMGIDFTVCDTLTQDSILEDIIAKLGAPTSIGCSIREYNGLYDRTTITIEYEQAGETYDRLKFELSGDGNYIVSIDYSVAYVQTMFF